MIIRRDFILIALTYMAFSFQNFEFFSVGSNGVKIAHVWLVILYAFFWRPYYDVSNNYMNLVIIYVAYVIVLSIAAYMFFNFNFFVINYFFVFFVLVGIGGVIRKISVFVVVKGLKTGAVFILFISLINALKINMTSGVESSVKNAALDGARPIFEFMVYGGGWNMEATWVALGGAFFMKARLRTFLMYIIGSTIISSIYLSRSGFIASAMIFIIYIAVNYKFNRIIVFLFYSMPFVILVLVFSLVDMESNQLFYRFTSIGVEPGSMERIIMWEYSLPAVFRTLIFGVGAGNGLDFVNSFGYVGSSDNLHNYILHNMIEFGLVGLLLWLGLVAYTLLNRSAPVELRAYVLVFFTLSMIQYRGAENVFYLVFALLACAKYKNTASVTHYSFRQGLRS